MAKRRTPKAISASSTIVYPSALFCLERDEFFPFERLAYNVLDVAIEALHAKTMPESVTVDFSDGAAPWTINASVGPIKDETGRTTGFRFTTGKFVPTLLYLFCAKVGAKLVAGVADGLSDDIREFGDLGNAGVREYKQRGLGHAIRAAHGACVDVEHSRACHSFDLLTKLLASHEAGHVYANHFAMAQDANAVTRRGLELIADLLSTTWFYNKYIRNTPDDSSYRQARNVASHAEAVFVNSMEAQRSQLALLALMAIAGAQRNGGRVTLDGGSTHPPGLQRHMLQHVHLGTLIESNFGSLLTQEYFSILEKDHQALLASLVGSGVIPPTEVLSQLDSREFDTVEAAALTIQRMGIEELTPAVPVLLQAREIAAKSLASQHR